MRSCVFTLIPLLLLKSFRFCSYSHFDRAEAKNSLNNDLTIFDTMIFHRMLANIHTVFGSNGNCCVKKSLTYSQPHFQLLAHIGYGVLVCCCLPAKEILMLPFFIEER